VTGEGDTKDERTINDLLATLVDDTDRFVRAELRLFRAKAVCRVEESRAALGLAIGALALLQAIFAAVLVGAIVALTPTLGAGMATVIVGLVGIVVALILLTMAWSRLKAAFDFGDDEGGLL
jgi:hypothetical protein